MPTISKNDAAEKLARAVTSATPTDLAEIYAELFPETPAPSPPPADKIARLIRGGLEAEEIVDLWNVVFPEDRHVWYDEELQAVRYNEELIEYAD